MKRVLVDTGPLVAVLNEQDANHQWALGETKKLPVTLFTCEAVLSEVHFLTENLRGARQAIEDLLADGWLDVSFSVGEHHTSVHELMMRYENVPMSFADACMVRMSELWDAPIFTLDADFKIYRRNRRQIIPIIHPG